MIVNFKNGEQVYTLENAEMRSIYGGADETSQS